MIEIDVDSNTFFGVLINERQTYHEGGLFEDAILAKRRALPTVH
jgi:hypothetical protein